MENAIKLAQALGWPIAATLISLVVLIIVLRVTAGKGELSFGIKDWFKFRTKSIDATATQAAGLAHRPAEAVAIDETTAETVAEVTADSEAPTVSSSQFWTTSSAADIEESFSRFKEEKSYKDDPEFWESIYVDRRRELSIGDEVREFTLLSDTHRDWVWPLIFLIRRYVRLRDSGSAEAALESALARNNAENRRWVLREGISLFYRLYGFDKAIAFCRDHVNGGASDSEISAMLSNLVDLSDINKDVFSSVILREISVKFDRDNKSSLFDLAYRYGFDNEFRVVAFERYRQLGTSNKDWPSAPNNMGVAIHSFSKAAGRDFYEKALELESGVAAANLARGLANDGYVRRAESILESVKEEFSGMDAKVLADARAKVAAARSEIEEEIEKFQTYASKQDSLYTTSVMAAFSFFMKSGVPFADGAFSSSDGSVAVSANAEAANCTYRVGETTYKGRLPRKPLCYAGTVSSEGTILNQISRQMLIVHVGEDDLRIIVWPDVSVPLDPLRVFEAKRELGQPQTVLTESPNSAAVQGDTGA